jgi:hypothetical protein
MYLNMYAFIYPLFQYSARIKSINLLYTLAPWGSQKQDPGDKAWKKNNSCFVPICMYM